MLRTTTFAPGEFYHLYSRGVDKRIIFLDEQDYKRFIKLLFLCNGDDFLARQTSRNLSISACIRRAPPRREPLVFIGAYCLMPNHFHVLIKEREPLGTSRFLRKLLTSYSMYFNTRYKRTGRLFESSFKAKHVADDNHLRHLFTYIHMNPQKVFLPHANFASDFLFEKLAGYEFSSFCDYLGREREEGVIIHQGEFPDYFGSGERFLQTLKDWYVDNWTGLSWKEA